MNFYELHAYMLILHIIYFKNVAQMVKNLSAMLEIWVWSLSQEDPLDKGMATHSSIFAWEIPWTEETGKLQFMGTQIVRHHWATNTCSY